MRLLYLAPFLLGALAVLQAGLNRQFGARMGLSTAVLTNGFIVFFLAAVTFGAAYYYPGSFPEWFRAKGGRFSWWNLLPGLFGFTLIFCGPWLVDRIGALKVFILIIAGQLTVSLLWDAQVVGLPVTPAKVGGALLALAGAALACWR